MSRIEEARRRAAGAKRLAVGAAGAGFLVALLLTRADHPGRASVSPGSSKTQATQTQSESDNGLDLGSASVAPSTGSSQPQTQTSVS